MKVPQVLIMKIKSKELAGMYEEVVNLVTGNAASSRAKCSYRSGESTCK